jgi:hypothetical protein
MIKITHNKTLLSAKALHTFIRHAVLSNECCWIQDCGYMHMYQNDTIYAIQSECEALTNNSKHNEIIKYVSKNKKKR